MLKWYSGGHGEDLAIRADQAQAECLIMNIEHNKKNIPLQVLKTILSWTVLHFSSGSLHLFSFINFENS